jgi:hypothetical protein
MLRGKTTTQYRSRGEVPVNWVQNVQAVQAVQNVWIDLNYLNDWNCDEDKAQCLRSGGLALDRASSE